MRGRTTQQLSFGDGFIDPSLVQLDEELTKVDELLSNREFLSSENLTDLRDLGVKRVGVAKIGRLKPREHRRQKSKWFKQLQRFRCGIEAGISMLKRCFSLGRILSPGSTGTRIWVGFSVLSYNLWQMT